MPSIRKILLRLIAPVVILILLWSQSSFVILQVARLVHYKEVRGSGGHSLSKFRDTITISAGEAKELVWVKDDEIKYNGKMFDVKRQLLRGDKVLLVGHYDSKDDKLFSAIRSFFGQSDQNNDKGRGYVPHLLTIEAVLPDMQYHLSKCDFDTVPQDFTRPSHYSYSKSSDTFQPPEFS